MVEGRDEASGVSLRRVFFSREESGVMWLVTAFSTRTCFFFVPVHSPKMA